MSAEPMKKDCKRCRNRTAKYGLNWKLIYDLGLLRWNDMAEEARMVLINDYKRTAPLGNVSKSMTALGMASRIPGRKREKA